MAVAYQHISVSWVSAVLTSRAFGWNGSPQAATYTYINDSYDYKNEAIPAYTDTLKICLSRGEKSPIGRSTNKFCSDSIAKIEFTLLQRILYFLLDLLFTRCFRLSYQQICMV
jgi:hypothetical protein